MLIFKSGFTVSGLYHRMDSATHEKIPFDFHPARAAGLHQILQNFIRHGFVKSPFIAVTPKVKFQALQLHAKFVWNIKNPDDRKIRLPGLRAKAGEFRTLKMNLIIPLRIRVRKYLNIFGGL